MADRKPSSPALRTAPAGQEAGRARVLEAARALFEEKGAAGLSMRAIAARAGMPTMTVYGYFPGKTAIIRALWSLAFGPLFEAMTAAESKAPHARGRLDAAARAYVDYWLAHADRYRMVFLVEDRRERADDGWFIDQTDVVASYMRFGPLIANARGEPGADRTAEAEALICALTGVAHMAITVSEYPWRAPEGYVDLLVEGVCRAAR